MYSHTAYSRTAPKSKTPKNASSDVTSIFRMPSPLSPTFITTQSLGRPGAADSGTRKKERVSSSPGVYHANRQAPISPKMVSDGRTRQYPPTTVYNGAYSASQMNNGLTKEEDNETNIQNNMRYHEREKSRAGSNNEIQRVSRAQVYLPGDHVSGFRSRKFFCFLCQIIKYIPKNLLF